MLSDHVSFVIFFPQKRQNERKKPWDRLACRHGDFRQSLRMVSTMDSHHGTDMQIFCIFPMDLAAQILQESSRQMIFLAIPDKALMLLNHGRFLPLKQSYPHPPQRCLEDDKLPLSTHSLQEFCATAQGNTVPTQC